MTPVCWWLVHKASGLLDPDERNAVLGDFSESGTSGAQALQLAIDTMEATHGRNLNSKAFGHQSRRDKSPAWALIRRLRRR
jgi:hypothetical protein